MRELEAYLMMFQFLEDRYKRGPSDELGNLLGAMQLDEDGLPFDPALAEDWKEAVETVLAAERRRAIEQLPKAS